jgi:transcription initiation factor TFIIIB Brf1 subunit/transcription initiation factor TFIIB
MINIYDIIQVLAPEYKISKKSSIKQHLVIKDIEKCKLLVKLIEDNDIMNDNSPTSSAAGILYYYASVKNLGYTKKIFAKACNVSEVTIIKCYKIINNYHKFIISHKSNIFDI